MRHVSPKIPTLLNFYSLIQVIRFTWEPAETQGCDFEDSANLEERVVSRMHTVAAVVETESLRWAVDGR